jgi:hypothetical protein
VSVMGAVLGSRITSLVTDGIAKLGIDPSQAGGLGDGGIPDLSTLPGPIRTIVESAYGEAVADVFLIAVPLAVISIIAIALLPNRALGTKTAVEQLAETEQTIVDVSAAEIAGGSRRDESASSLDDGAQVIAEGSPALGEAPDRR